MITLVSVLRHLVTGSLTGSLLNIIQGLPFVVCLWKVSQFRRVIFRFRQEQLIVDLERRKIKKEVR